MPETPPRRRCDTPRTNEHPAAAPECHRPRDRPSWTPYSAAAADQMSAPAPTPPPWP